MTNLRKSFALTALVISMSCVGLAASDIVLKHTRAQTATTSNEKAQADKLFQEGVQQYRRGEFPKALATYQKVLEIRRRLNDKAGIAQALNNIGQVYNKLPEREKEALDVLQQALAIRRELKNRKGEGETLDNIGSAYRNLNQYEKALATLQQALSIRREVKDRTGEGVTLRNIGSTYLDLKQHPKALEFLQQARAIHQEVGDKFQLGMTIFGIGIVYNDINDDKNALLWLNQALAFSREIGNRTIESRSLMLIGSVYFSQQQYDRSIEYSKQALAIAQAIPDDKYFVLLAFEQLSNLYSLKSSNYNRGGLIAQAKVEAKNAIEIAQSILNPARELKKPESEANALVVLGDSYRTLGENQKALGFAEQALKIAREIKNLDIEYSILRAMNSIYFNQGENILKRIEIQKRQVEIARVQKEPLNEAQSLLQLGDLYQLASKYQLAISTFQEALAVAQKIEINKLLPSLQEYAQNIQLSALRGLSSSYNNLGEIGKALDFAQQAVKKAQIFNNPKLEAEALLHVSFIYSNAFQDNQKSIDTAQQALSIAHKIKEQQIEANALEQLGNNYKRQGNYPKALEASEQLLSLAKQLDNSKFEYDALKIWKDVYQAQGDLQKALLTAQQIVTITQQKNLGGYEGSSLNNLSDSYLLVGNTTKAMESAQQALAIAKKQNTPTVEALALNNIANAYKLRGEYQQAIAASQQSLDISSKNKDLIGEIAAVYHLADIYEALGEYQKFIAVAEPYLPRLKQLNNRSLEAQFLSGIGNAYDIIGANQKGKALVEQSLVIARELKNPALESTVLNYLGSIYNSRNEYQKALELTQQSLKIAQDLQSPPLKIAPLSTLANTYYHLGNYNKSREYFQQVLANVKTLQNRRAEGGILVYTAITYFAQDQPQKTVELSQQALAISREIKEPRLEAVAHLILSAGYGELGNDASAMQEAQTFLTFARQTKNPAFEKTALNLIGDLHRKFRRPEAAISSYQAALGIKTDTLSGSDGGIYAGLGQAYVQLNKTDEAIKNYQLAINSIESVRRNIQGLPPELQSSFLLAKFDFNKVKTADIYRQYADLLLKQGRTLQAQQVLELLKFQEVQDYLRAGTKPDAATNNQIIALGKELSELEIIPENKRTSNQQQRVIELRKQQGKLALEYGEFVKNPEIAKRIDELRQSTQGKNFDPKEQARILQDKVKRVQQDAVIIYPLVLKDRLELILVTPYAPPIHRTVKVSETELNKTIEDFRRDLQSPSRNPVSNAGKLYQWLIQPLESDLAAAKTKTIMFAPDGKLRYIPLAALHDGKQWLIERFDINNITALSLIGLNTRPQTKKQVLTAAFSDTSRSVTVQLGSTNATFQGLKYAGTEVDGITAAIPGSTKLVNNQFNQDIVYRMNDYSIVHLATHAAFVNGKPEDSVILLGDGKHITLRDVEAWNLPNVDLIVLSACETGLGGFGDGKEILGFGYQVEKIGAKAAIASLWQVDDPSTAQLMQQFYNNLAQKAPITKAEALRQAQLSLLKGTSVKQNSDQRGLQVTPPNNPSNQKVYAGNQHPYYWAPFILIGNGL